MEKPQESFGGDGSEGIPLSLGSLSTDDNKSDSKSDNKSENKSPAPETRVEVKDPSSDNARFVSTPLDAFVRSTICETAKLVVSMGTSRSYMLPKADTRIGRVFEGLKDKTTRARLGVREWGE
jgi:hypothetical protein